MLKASKVKRPSMMTGCCRSFAQMLSFYKASIMMPKKQDLGFEHLSDYVRRGVQR